jgi:hypothetical protein
MTRSSKQCVVLLALVALAATTGCEKRPTGVGSISTAPEGIRATDARLLAFRNTPRRVMVRDYQSTNIDSVVVQASPFAGSANMPLLMLVDGTAANSVELYRRSGGGAFERTRDFPLQNTVKFVNTGYELYFSTDPSPGPYTPSSYVTRGLVDGVASRQSPLSNEALITSLGLLPILYNGSRHPIDSLFAVSWIGVPNAAGYWVHLYEKPLSGGERLKSAYPAPIAYTTAGDLLIGYRAGNNPGGPVSFNLGDPSLLTIKSRAPLVGHEYLVRISAVDNSGHVFAQTPGDLDSLPLSPDLAYLAPSSFSTEKSKIFYSLGGVSVARQIPVPAGPAAVLAPENLGADLTIERHVPLSPFPFVLSSQVFKSRRGGHH